MVELGHHVHPAVLPGVPVEECQELIIVGDPPGTGDEGARPEPDERKVLDI